MWVMSQLLLLTYAHCSQWSIGHLQPLAIPLCSGLLWPFQTSCLVNNLIPVGVPIHSSFGGGCKQRHSLCIHFAIGTVQILTVTSPQIDVSCRDTPSMHSTQGQGCDYLYGSWTDAELDRCRSKVSPNTIARRVLFGQHRRKRMLPGKLFNSVNKRIYVSI